MTNLCNPRLFRALQRVYGDVRVIDAGRFGDYVRKEEVKQRAGVARTYVSYRVPNGGSYGERYQLNCPFCGDTRGRAYINHLFGTWDKGTGARYLYGWVCHRRECQENYSNCQDLWEDISISMRYSDHIVPEKKQQFSEAQVDNLEFLSRPPTAVGLPGLCLDLTELVPGTRDYRAFEYLSQDRNFDVGVLTQKYGVRYLKESHYYSFLAGRVFTPFFRGGEMFAWTTRVIPGLGDEEHRHFHSPGGLGGVLYGLGSALQRQVMIIVEGTADRWAAGDNSVAILNKKLLSESRARLLTGLANSHVKIILVALDPNWAGGDQEAGKQHHIVSMVEMLKASWGGIVLPCWLPLDEDPASLGGVKLARYCYELLRSGGFAEIAEPLAREVWSSTATRK